VDLPSKLAVITVRLTQVDKDRLNTAAAILTLRQNEEGRPGRLSSSDMAVTAIRRYLKELEDNGTLPLEAVK
jgi:hypothetical protein